MSDWKISIIVPVYNAGKYLHRCFESVRKQIYQNWELIFIDDGSKDNSGLIIDEFAHNDNRVRVWHQDNSGVSVARNQGIEMSTGNCVMFLDADDELLEDCLGDMLKILKEEKADIVAGRNFGDCCTLDTENGIQIWRNSDSLKNSLMDNPFTYSAWAKLFRRDCIGNTRFQSNIKINEDSYFVFEIICKQPVFVCVDKQIYLYRNTPESASRATFSEKYFDILRVADMKYKLIETAFPQLLELAKNMQLKAKMNLLHILALRTGNEYHSLEKELISWIRKNKKYYISATKADDKWWFVINNHLYYLYKTLKSIERS